MFKLKNCCITQKDSVVIKQFSSTEKLNQNGHYGVDILCDDVFSICFGIVAMIHTEDNHYHISVQYNDSILLRYCNLNKCYVTVGQPIVYNQLLGVADNHIHFEYCIPVMQDSSRCVRICNVTYMKSNPLPVLMNRAQFVPDFRDNMNNYDNEENEVATVDEITESVLDEFTGGRGNE